MEKHEFYDADKYKDENKSISQNNIYINNELNEDKSNKLLDEIYN